MAFSCHFHLFACASDIFSLEVHLIPIILVPTCVFRRNKKYTLNSFIIITRFHRFHRLQKIDVMLLLMIQSVYELCEFIHFKSSVKLNSKHYFAKFFVLCLFFVPLILHFWALWSHADGTSDKMMRALNMLTDKKPHIGSFAGPRE